MARPNSGNDLYATKEQSHFYASAEFYLSTMQHTEWYGLGKYSAEEEHVFPYPGGLVEIAVGLEARYNMVGGHWLFTTPLFTRAELRNSTRYQATTTSAEVGLFRLYYCGALFYDGIASAKMAFKKKEENTASQDGAAAATSVAVGTDTETAVTKLINSYGTPPVYRSTQLADDAAATAGQLAMAGILSAAASLFVSQMKKVAEESDNSKSAKMQDQT